MKKSLSIIAVFTLAFFKAGCSYAGSDSTTDVTVNIPVLDSYEGFKLQDKDGKRTDGAVNNADYIRNGNTYTVYASDNYGAEDSSGKSVANVIKNMKEGDTLVFDGSKGIFYFRERLILNKSSVTVKGVNNAILDFSKINPYSKEEINQAIELVKAYYKNDANQGGHYLSYVDESLRKVTLEGSVRKMSDALGRLKGISLNSTNYVIVEDLIIQNAPSSGLQIYASHNETSYVKGNYNIIRNVESRFNGDSGFQISSGLKYSTDINPDCIYYTDGPHDNKFFNCYSHDNYDPWNLGENADGFAMKGGTGDRNYFENCISEYNSDDGWDFFHIRGSCTFVNCIARYNGLNRTTKKAWAECANGNGFKLGGGSTDAEKADNPHPQYLKGCIAYGNAGNSGVGFDRNNQYGSIYLENCWSGYNGANLPQYGKTTLRSQNYALNRSGGNDCYIFNCWASEERAADHLGFLNGIRNTITGIKN